ncbi:MAG: PH domain-containing protein [Cryomorphaceae bacterium]|nr:PH domain-containing protein [Flavobacteriales bacterium]
MEITWENKEVVGDALPALEKVNFQKHPVRYKRYRYLVSGILWLIPLTAVVILNISLEGYWRFLPIGIMLVLVAFNFASIRIGFSRRGYALRERDLTYRKGWLFYSTTTLPFNRIQHTEVSQGPVEKKFELCTLKIFTAGGSTSDLSIPGLEEEEAQQLRDYISKKAAIYA